MREIKFRAWDKLNSRMQNWEGLRGYCDIDHLFGGFYERGTGHPYNYPIAMQYTGLMDKNGKEIYEGDIIRFTNGIDEVYEEVGTVVFDLEECGYKAQYTDDGVTHCIYLINPKVFADKYTEITYEVIGNIYENSKLHNG